MTTNESITIMPFVKQCGRVAFDDFFSAAHCFKKKKIIIKDLCKVPTSTKWLERLLKLPLEVKVTVNLT